MKISNLFLMLLMFTAVNISKAQNSEKSLDDTERLNVSVWIPEQDDLPEGAKQNLENKLLQIATNNGLSGTGGSRFIVTANMIVTSKDITPTAPPMEAYNIDVTFYIGDGVDGTKFASYTTSVKGVGRNQTKAMNSAFKNIKIDNPKYQSFIAKGKKKIIEYYNTRCEFLIKEAQSLASQNKFEEAIFKLTGVPEVCKECYDQSLDAIAPMYQQMINRDCKMKLNAANNIWSANQDVGAANEAGELLSTIEPNSVCFDEVKTLASQIAKRVLAIDGREWKYILKDQSQTSEMIQAYRAIGVAYGNGQPETITYNVRGWW